MAETLTPQQREAVENRGGKLLVSAAAGSGKTKVLVDRLMRYILDPTSPANIDDFLIITYTKAAASELRSKIAVKLSELIAQGPATKHLQQQMQRLYLAKISTVHGFCTDLLRKYAYCLDISADFRVADEGECVQLQMKALETILNNAYDSADTDPYFCAFVDSQGLGRDDRQVPEIILKVYNSARCHLLPDAWLDWCASGVDPDVTDAGQTPWGQYLISDLKQYLNLQMDAFNNCIKACVGVEGMDKPSALFASTVEQLQKLYDCTLWDEIVNNRQLDYGRLTFPKNCTDIQLSQQMKAVREACKAGLTKRLKSFADESEQVLSDLMQSVYAAKGLVGLVREFAKEYDRLKKGRGVLDFGDLEHKTLDLLLGKKRAYATSIAAEVSERFREIMVDEYQDSNAIQDAIFSSLTQKRQNGFMVGDVKQSIYQFRLADPSIFMEKYNTYLPAESAQIGDGRKVLLSHNFRSSGGVISGVNDVFSLCMSPSVGGLYYTEDEMLREGIPHISLHEPEVSLCCIDVQSDTYAEESELVANKIADLLDGSHYVREKDTLRPIRPDDIVILLRSPGSVGGDFAYALQSRGIRCAFGDGSNLLESEEIATVCSILQIVNNPLQDIPLVSALTSPIFGFTADDLARLRSVDRNSDIYILLCNATDTKSVNFLSVLQNLRATARVATVTQLLSAVYTQTGLLSTYSAFSDGHLRLANLQSFFQIVSDFETSGPRELGRLLEYLCTAEERGLPGVTQQTGNAVTIMSIHKSKGLEFPVVFLCGLSRSFNQESAYAQVLCDKDLGLGLGCVDAKLRVRYPSVAKRAISAKIIQESVSEEMRVLYVAMSRAKDRLFMTYAVKNLPSNLEDTAMRLDMCSTELLSAEAGCAGDWIIQTALQRTEAGALFALAGHPDCTKVSTIPWDISVSEPCALCVVSAEETAEKNCVSDELLKKITTSLKFSYANSSATHIPSKLTATQLKGRVLDTEVAENTMGRQSSSFREIRKSVKTGKDYGNTIHSVMQYIRFDACTNLEGIHSELARMVSEQLISAEQANWIDCERLLRFFTSDIGLKLQKSTDVLREFKFSLLDYAEKYYPDAAGEQVLLQGVVDCAVIEADGIVVLDFKTDYVTENTLASVTEKYTSQVKLYAQALERIYQKPVKSAMLYFFHMDKFVPII